MQGLIANAIRRAQDLVPSEREAEFQQAVQDIVARVNWELWILFKGWPVAKDEEGD